MQAKDSFICNICGSQNELNDFRMLHREFTSSICCGSSPRMRCIIHALSSELFGESLTLPNFPRTRKKGIGISDWDGYAVLLAKKLNYTNTFYHKEPFLDITSVPNSYKGKYDFVICSDVLEHVIPPVENAFLGLYDLLKPNGVLIFSIPYILNGDCKEFYPNLYNYEIIQFNGKKILKNITKNGTIETFENLEWHGGEGATLAMRLFTEKSMLQQLHRVGFNDIKYYRMCLKYGIFWPEAHHQILSARV